MYARCWLGKGQVENQVDNIREWLFTPRAKFNNFADLNAWLAKRCEELAQRKHPVYTSQTIAECYQKVHALLRKMDGANGFSQSDGLFAESCG